jgi:predicted RNA-binding Zn-ribbon protein involved in translation (DUF1610 family)
MLKSVLKLLSEVAVMEDARVIECPECGKQCWFDYKATKMASEYGSKAIIHCTDCERRSMNEQSIQEGKISE